MFVPSADWIVLETLHWRVNQRVDAKLPGYLIMAPKDPSALSFSTLSPEAQLEMGPLLARITRAIEVHLRPLHLYTGRYGHMIGHNFHFHIIPVYGWVAEAFHADHRYRALRQFDTSGVYNSGSDTGFDGAEMTLFIWRELAESLTPPDFKGPGVRETIEILRQALIS